MEKVLSQETIAITLRTLRVQDIAVSNPVTVYADEPIWTAIQKMAPRDLARLPVVSRDGKGHLLGLISRSDILRAYDVGIVRKQRGQLLDDQAVLRREKYNDFIEFRLNFSSKGVQHQLKELSLSRFVNVVSVERNGVLLIPKGDTSFEEGDIVTLFGRREYLAEARQEFVGKGGD